MIECNLNSYEPIIISIPHSGVNYNKVFLNNILLSKNEMQYSEDSYVDELFYNSIKSNISYVKALFPRSYVDVNRHPFELDPLMFETNIPNFLQSKSNKVQNGIGVIPRISAYGNEIYDNPLKRTDIISRLLNNYFPYHKALKKIIKNIKNKFNNILLLDCHSMPSISMVEEDIDIILGNNFNLSSSLNITNIVKENLESLNYTVKINKPYSGGFITKYYGKPKTGIHVIQLEINRKIYMYENTLMRNKNKMIALSNDLEIIINLLSNYFKKIN